VTSDVALCFPFVVLFILGNQPAHDDCEPENPTFHPTYQPDTTGRNRHHRTSFLSNPDDSDTTGPNRPFASTS
jgi:hypothetical protein